MNWHKIWAIIGKDIKEIKGNNMVLMPMIAVPILLGVVIPVVMTILVFTIDVNMMNNAQMIERILPFYSIPEHIDKTTEQILYVFLNFSFLPLFMVIPVMVSSILTANSVVGEKERNTLETLLYTPVTNREFIIAKLLGSFLPGAILSLLSFILYFISVNVISYTLAGYIIVNSPIWIPAMLLLSPALSILGLAFTLMVSIKAKSFMEAQQMSATIVIPIILLLIVQISGLVVFNTLYVTLFSIVLIIADYFLVTKITPRFDRERIISTL